MADNSTNNNDDQEMEIKQKEEKIKELETRIGEQDSRLNYLQSSGFQLANFYFVFQGVILTAIVNGNSSLGCAHLWFLLSLSVLPAVLNLFSLLIIGRNYLRSYVQRDQTWVECNKLQTEVDHFHTSRNSRRLGDELELRSSPFTVYFTPLTEHNDSPPSQEAVEEEGRGQGQTSTVHVDTWEQGKRKFYFRVCMGLFGCFALIMTVGCCTVLCKKDDQCKHPKSNNDNCIRLCEGAKCMNICNDF